MTPQDVIRFWFSPEAEPHWFAASDAFDRTLTERFGELHRDAVSGDLDHWADEPDGWLALILLFDQFSRNLHRGTPRAFATDARARVLAEEAVQAGRDRALPAERRAFVYLPFMHSESFADQDRGVALYTALGNPGQLDYMHRHRAIIARFGRFPHRNAVLGRESTAEEIAFLKEPGSAF